MTSSDGALYEDAACGLLQLGEDATILRVNATFCRWTGYARQELVGARRLPELFTAAGRLFYQTHWQPAMHERGSIAELKVEVRHKDGTRLPMLFNAARAGGETPGVEHVAAMIVLDRQRYEAELIRAREQAEAAHAALASAHRRKDEFLATLSHELRNPLAPLRTGVALIRLRDLQDPVVGRTIEIFDRQLGHLTRMVDALLESSRLTLGKVTLNRQRFDLREALDVAVEAVRPRFEAAGQRLHLDVPATPAIVFADPFRVTQMVSNLLANATKFTPSGGQVWLVAHVAAEVTIAVRDTGIGIPASGLADIFEMFSQLAPAGQRADSGLGIGLAIVRGLAELHGGAVRASSPGEDQGAEFVITLPAEPAGAPPSRRDPDPGL